MEPNVSKQVQERFEELPEVIQKAIQSVDSDKKIQEVASKYQLHIDQTGALGDEVYLVMLGFTSLDAFADSIAKNVNVPSDTAAAIAKDISNDLFIPIRAAMQEFTEERVLQENLKDHSSSVERKSVVMPSKTVAPETASISPMKEPAVSTATPASGSVAPTPSVPAKPAEMHPAEVMLTEKTVQVAPTQQKPESASADPSRDGASKSASYKADPYREPPE